MSAVPQGIGESSIFTELGAKQEAILAVPIGKTFNNFVFIKKWSITKAPGGVDVDLQFRSPTAAVAFRTTAGIGTINIGFFDSIDDVTWNTLTSLSTASGSFVSSNLGQNNQTIDRTSRFFGIGCYNSYGTTSGEIKNSILAGFITLPPGWTMSVIAN